MTHATGGELAQRLFERLLAALGGEDRPLTIGDLYQRLIPYRTVRQEIGVMELASYEHALLRLLGGEGGHLEVDAEPAAAEIRHELASPNPILGIYRDYADVPVRIAGIPKGSGPIEDHASEPAPTSSEPADSAVPAPSTGIVVLDSESAPPMTPLRSGDRGRAAGPEAPSASRVPSSPEGTSPSPQSAARMVCSGCGNELPAVEGVRFCPFCGQGREPSPCDRCGTPIQPEWNFCIRCGASAGP